MQFIQARNFTQSSPGRTVELVVVHTMEAKEKPGTALAVAQWFAGPNAPQASAHYCVDDGETVGCVHEKDVAWAAPGANRNGVHIEHAGFASQTAADWSDPYSQAMLARSATLCAEICKRYSIPVVKLTAQDLLQHQRGLCGHAEVTEAFHKSDHTDPGKNFPWPEYLALVAAALATLNQPAPEPEPATV